MASNDGKIAIVFYLLISLVFLYSLTYGHMTTLRSGLLFDKLYEQETLINGRMLTLRRRISTSPLYNAVDLLSKIVIKFGKLCEKVERAVNDKRDDRKLAQIKQQSWHVNKVFEYRIVDNALMSKAQEVCEKHNGFLPEIRTKQDLDSMREIAQLYKLRYIPANIRYDPASNRIQFISDGIEPYKGGYEATTYSFGPYNKHAPHTDSDFLAAAFQSDVIAYTYWDDRAFPIIKALSRKESDVINAVVCKAPIPSKVLPPAVNHYDEMTVHLCNRDNKQNEQVYTHIARMVEEIFTQSNVPLAYNLDDKTANQTREKRLAFLPAVALGVGSTTLGTSLIHSSITGKSPLGFIGTAMGRVFGLATAADVETTWEALQKQSQSIDDMMINLKEVKSQSSMIIKAMEEIQTTMISLDQSLAFYLMLQDLNGLIQNMSSLILSLVGDVVNALADSATGTYNALLLTPKELADQQLSFLRTYQLRLDITPSAVKTAVFRTKSDFNVIYMIPIIEPEHSAFIYQVTTLPVFYQGKAYRPLIDTNYIAFFVSNQVFAPLTSSEYQTCKQTPWLCTTAAARAPVSDQTSCVAQTFLGTNLICPLKEVNETLPEFKVRGNNLIYSTLNTETVYVQCKNSTIKTFEQTLLLQGMGLVTLPFDCQILLPRNHMHTTTSTGFMVDLTESQFFKPIQQFPNFTDILPNPQSQITFSPIPRVNYTQIRPMNFTELLAKTFHYENTIKVLSPTVLVLLIIASIILTCCCCNKCVRQYCSTCLLLRPQHVWMQRIQNASQGEGRTARLLKRWAKMDTDEPIPSKPPSYNSVPTSPPAEDAIIPEGQFPKEIRKRSPILKHFDHIYRIPKRPREPDSPTYHKYPVPEQGQKEALLTFLPLPTATQLESQTGAVGPAKKARPAPIYPTLIPGMLPMPLYQNRPPVSDEEIRELADMLDKLTISDQPSAPGHDPQAPRPVSETKI